MSGSSGSLGRRRHDSQGDFTGARTREAPTAASVAVVPLVLVVVMGQQEDRARAKRDRIERLRKRLDVIKLGPDERQLRDVIKGILDLLEDEL